MSSELLAALREFVLTVQACPHCESCTHAAESALMLIDTLDKGSVPVL